MLIPIFLGLGVAAFMLYLNLTEVRFEETPASVCGNYSWVDNNGDGVVDINEESEFRYVPDCAGNYRKRTYRDSLRDINWSWYSTLWLLMAIIAMVLRDVGYMFRIRVLTDDALSWKQSFHVIMLWEFASALTPSVVGGSGIAMFILNREGIALGKSTAIVLVSALLDELFFISMVLLVMLLIGGDLLFPVSLEQSFFGFTLGTKSIFWLGYAFILLMTTTIFLAIFFRPRGFKYLLLQIFRLPILRRWRYQTIQVGEDIITTSEELKGRPAKYWFKATAATYLSWTARYLVVNFLILAFANSDAGATWYDQVIIYARQLVMWVIMLISPTPGSAGVAEFAFSGFLREFIPLGLVGALALLWRLVSYYPYLFIGAVILPRWLRSTGRRIREKKHAE